MRVDGKGRPLNFLITALAWREQKVERTALAIDTHMQLGGEAAAAAA